MWCRVTSGCRVAFLLSAGCLFFAPSGGLAAESAGKLPPDAMAGQVLDPSGKPAAGATVWLVGGPYDEDAKTLERGVVDAQGRFVFAQVESKYIRPRAWPPHLAASDSQGRLGWSPFPWVRQGAGKWTPQQALRITLFAVEPYRGRLVDAAGRPIAKATICPESLASDSLDDPHRLGAELPAELARDLTCQTAADGTFTVPRLPAVGFIRASVTASGFGSPRIAWNLAEPVSLRLERAGSVRGTVAVSAGAVVLTTLKLSLYTASEGAKTGGAAFRVSHQTTTFPAKDGKFAFEGVPPGNCTIQAELYRSNLPYYAPKPTRVEVKPAETAMIEVQLLPAIAVRGRVVDAANGHGIQGVEVSVEHYADKRGHPSSWRDTTTDANGRFVGYSEPGRITAYAGGVPGAYSAPDVGRSWPTMVATADVTWPTFKLERVVQLEGIVVDEAQKPVPDTEVQALVACHGEQSPRVQRTDANGRFVVRGLDAQQMLSLRARSAAGTSNALDLRPAEASAPVRLVLSSQNAFTLKGVCVDEAGRPVRKAEAGVRSPWMLGPTGLFVSVGNCETDARGRFQIGPLWPGFEYDVNVTSAGYAKYQSRRVKGQPGQMHDLGKIVLVDQSGFVDGRVIDSAGLPLAGVQVFLHREAVKPQRTTTDAAGRFRLEGLRFGRTFVCAKKEGYRLQAVATTSRTTGLSVTLLRRDEPVPPWKPRRPPASSGEEQAVARRLLEKLYAVPKKGPTSRSYRFMARLDPSRAVQLRRNGGRVDDETQRMAAEKIADVDEAIALLTRSDNYQTFATLISLATHYAKSDAAKAQRLAEEAVLMARKLDQPDRTTALAEAGSMAVKLGHVEAGRKLIAEAAEMAAKMAASGRHAYVRINLATALAPYDLDRALSLVEPLAANDKERALARIAGAIAPSHLDKALELLSRLETRSTLPDNTRLKIAYQLAANRPQDALRVVESMNTFGAQKIQAEAYGWLAVAIAPRDRKLAWSLIDKSFAIYNSNAEQMRSWTYYGGSGTFAAHVITQASRIGYPDIGLLIDRALAMRPTEGDGSRLRQYQKNTIFMAGVLALVDPASATALLETVSPRCDGFKEFGHPGPEVYDWYQAWALADLPQAAGTLERRLEAARTDPHVDLDNCGLDQTLDLLTTPAADRVAVLDRYVCAFWSPSDDDR